MQPAAVASPTGAAAALDPGFGGCAGVRAAHAGPLGPETLVCSPARVAHGTLGRADPADSPVWQPLQIVSSQRSSSALLTPAAFPLSLPRVARPPRGSLPTPTPASAQRTAGGAPFASPHGRAPRQALEGLGRREILLGFRMQESEPMLPLHL